MLSEDGWTTLVFTFFFTSGKLKASAMISCLSVVPRTRTIDHGLKAPDGKSKHFFLFWG